MTSSPHQRDDRPPTGGLPDLAFVAVCAGCGKTFVSALRPFPDIYRCIDCPTDRDVALKRKTAAFLATSPRCVHGHALTETTLHVSVSGARHCRICWRDQRSASLRRKQGMGYYEEIGAALDAERQEEDLP